MSTPESQILKCQCGAKLKVPAAAAGRSIRCPKCQATMSIPAGGPAAGQVPPAGTSKADVDPGGGLFDELATAESSASSTAVAPGAGANCPKCGRPMKAGATGCATCGHGASPRAADSGSASAAGKAAAATATAAKRAASVGGRFAIGCTLSAVGALVGAVIWYFVAVKSGYEVGYIAWGLGLAAGFGMIVGVRGQHELSGIAAAAIAAGGILAGKYMIFASFTGGAAIEEAMHGYDIAAHHAQLECFEKDLAPFSPECEEVQDRLEGQYDDMPDEQVERKYAETERWFTERWNDPKYVETYLIHALAQEAYEEELISTGGEDAEEEEIAFSKPTWDKHKAAAAKKVGDMSADSRLTEARRIADERDAARKAMIAALSSLISAKQGFFATMFDYMDIVFVLLALGSAYKLASGGGEAS